MGIEVITYYGLSLGLAEEMAWGRLHHHFLIFLTQVDPYWIQRPCYSNVLA
jgi:hypothetical protein